MRTFVVVYLLLLLGLVASLALPILGGRWAGLLGFVVGLVLALDSFTVWALWVTRGPVPSWTGARPREQA